jgi:outer membrane protein assembly factor BamA
MAHICLPFVDLSKPDLTCQKSAGRTGLHSLILAQHDQTVWRSLSLLLLCSLSFLAQKKIPSKAIRFQGAPQYTQQELLGAAGLKPEASLNSREVKAHAKQLNDTGLLEVIKFSSDSKTLLFTLTPAGQLFPMHLDNLPLTPDNELDAKLHERFPLHRRGLVPASGAMLEGICKTFEEMLAILEVVTQLP